MIVARFSYPDGVSGMMRSPKAFWSTGGEFEDFSDAIARGRELCEERNMPIEVMSGSVSVTVYPESVGY